MTGRIIGVLLAGTLTACGGDGGGGDMATGGNDTGTRIIASCNSILGATVASTPCPGCTIDGASNVADDDGYSYAAVDVPQAAPEAGAMLRATAPDGVVFPAGEWAGVFLTRPSGGGTIDSNTGDSVQLRTYLDGVLQETAVNKRSQYLPRGDDSSDLPQMFVSFHTSREFDAVEAVIGSGDATIGGPTLWKVHELCSDGWVED
jgi:hypothetical protein